MLHPVRVPPASGSLPPSDVPSGNTLGSITRRSQASALRPVQFPRQPHVRLVITRILRPPHPARPAGRRNPPPRFRSASPPPGSPPTALPKKLRAPACGIMFVPHIMPPAPARFPQRCCKKALRVRRSCRPHRRLARPPPSATASSAVLVIPGTSAFVPHLCSLVIPAGSLDPAPCGGKEHLSVLRSQNPV
jgi:hypothetical protein